MNFAGSLVYDTKVDTKGIKSGTDDVKNQFSTTKDWFKRELLGVVKNGIVEITKALVDMGKQAVEAFAEYEQLVGGVESIFKNSANQAEMVAKVTDKGSKAWKEMTMSYNDYYSKFNSTYPLIKSSLEDENEALDTTNRMLQLESDLANTFGYDMQVATNAINWALKGQWSYIDNLNIGIKGTKEGFLEAAHNAGYMVKNVNELSSTDILDILEKTADQFGVLGKTQQEAADTIQGNMKMLKASWENLLIAFAEGDVDAINEGMNNLFESFSNVMGKMEPVIMNVIQNIVSFLPKVLNELIKYLPKVIPLITQLVIGLVNLIIENLPLIIECAFQLLIGLAQGLTEAIPTLIPAIVDVVFSIVDFFIDNIDLLIETGIQLILALALGLIDAIPRLIEKIPEIIDKLIRELTKPEVLAQLIYAGIQLLLALIKGIVQTVGTLMSTIAQIPRDAVQRIKDKLNEFKDAGKELMQGLYNGITEKWNNLKKKVENLGSGIVSKFKSVFGIKSPSRIMRDAIGKQLTEGIAVGITMNTDSVDDAIDDLNDDILDRMTKAVNFEAGRSAFSGTNGTVTQMLSAFGTTTVVNENKLYLDGDEIYENQQTVAAKKNLQTQFGGGYSVSS